MSKRILPVFLVGIISFVVGTLVAGYIGLVIGETFLGGLELHKYIQIEGYELAAYIGAIITTIVGITYSSKFVK